MIVGRTMWTQCTSVTDGRTDRRTDRITITKTVQRIASHGKKLWTKFLGGVGQGPKNSITATIRITIRIQESEVRNPDSRDYRVTNGFWWNIMESSGVVYRDQLITFWYDPHHYPDPGVRSGSRSGSGKNCHNSVMLAFGGLCSLSSEYF